MGLSCSVTRTATTNRRKNVSIPIGEILNIHQWVINHKQGKICPIIDIQSDYFKKYRQIS